MSRNIKNALKISILLLTSSFILLFFFRPLEFEDGWWHLATGRWIVQNHAVPHYDPFSFSERPEPWIATHWLGSTIYYLVYEIGDIFGLQIFRLFLFVTSILIFAFYAKRKIPFYYLITLLFFLALGLSSRCLLRPLVFNFFFIQFFLIILINYKKNQDTRKLLWIIFLGSFWSNIHLGSFIYGSLLIGVFLFSATVQYGNFLIEQKKILYSKYYIKPIRDLSLTLIFFWLSMGISPYGLEALLYPWKTLLLPDFMHLYQAISIIQEAGAPNILSWNVWWIYVLIPFGFLCVVLDEKKDFTSLLLIIITTFFFLFATLGRDFGMIIFVYTLTMIGPHDHVINSKKRINQIFKAYRSFLFFLALIFMLFIIHDIKPTYRKYPINDHQETIKFLKSNSIYGRAFCSDIIGSYLTWSLYPNIKPFVDGRQVNKHRFFEEFYPTNLDPENRWERLDDTYNFDIVFLDFGFGYIKLAQYLAKNSKWQIVLVDGNDVIFVKKDSFYLPNRINNYQNSLQNTKLSVDQENTFKKLANYKTSKKPGSFADPSIYAKEILSTLTLSELGFLNAAIKTILDLQKQYGNTPFIVQSAHMFYDILEKNADKVLK